VNCSISHFSWNCRGNWPIIPSDMQDQANKSEAERLGQALRQRRRQLGIKQVDLAELANCSTRFVHTVEAGKATVRLDKLLDLLAVLGLGFELRPGPRLSVAAGQEQRDS